MSCSLYRHTKDVPPDAWRAESRFKLWHPANGIHWNLLNDIGNIISRTKFMPQSCALVSTSDVHQHVFGPMRTSVSTSQCCLPLHCIRNVLHLEISVFFVKTNCLRFALLHFRLTADVSAQPMINLADGGETVKRWRTTYTACNLLNHRLHSISRMQNTRNR